MVNNILYQVRVDVDEGLATEIRRGNYSEEAGAIKDKLKEFGAELICQFDAFSNYIIESEKTGDIDNPLYKWTKDTIANFCIHGMQNISQTKTGLQFAKCITGILERM